MSEQNMHSVELTDEELGEIHGGYMIWTDPTSSYSYIWRGTSADEDKRYLCPKCGRPVRYGKGYRYYCDSCHDSWFMEQALDPNLPSGLWQRTAKDPYMEY